MKDDIQPKDNNKDKEEQVQGLPEEFKLDKKEDKQDKAKEKKNQLSKKEENKEKKEETTEKEEEDTKKDRAKKTFWRDEDGKDRSPNPHDHRPDLMYLWLIISLIVVGSALVVGYYSITSKNKVESTQKQTESEKEEKTDQEPIASSNNYFYYLSANSDRAKVYKDWIETGTNEEILAFDPPADINNTDVSWDHDHSFAFIDDKGVETYNLNTEKKSILAPNRGVREYDKVQYAKDGKVACSYTKGEKKYLEIYSTSLRKIDKTRQITDFNWTNGGDMSYILVDKDESEYKFMAYNPDKGKFESYFEDYFGSTRYPISYNFYQDDQKVGFLLRDDNGSRSKIILSLGDTKTKKMSKITELLYFDSQVTDSSLKNPTVTWSDREDYLYASINNRIFKTNLTTGKAEELAFDFSGTVELINSSESNLYIRKISQDNEIKTPQSLTIYNLKQEQVVYNSSLNQIVKFIGLSN